MQNILNDGNIVYIRISYLPEKESIAFKKWLLSEGRTQPHIDGELDGDCAYPWDYELWKADPKTT